MGQAQVIIFPDNHCPSWEAIRDQVISNGTHVHLRMIDGLPAFPNESPGSKWQELRVLIGNAMFTLRRIPGGIECVSWSDLDNSALVARHRLIWACAAAGNGRVKTLHGDLGAEDFAKTCGITVT